MPVGTELGKKGRVRRQHRWRVGADQFPVVLLQPQSLLSAGTETLAAVDAEFRQDPDGPLTTRMASLGQDLRQLTQPLQAASNTFTLWDMAAHLIGFP
jgi:hypothetical protein